MDNTYKEFIPAEEAVTYDDKTVVIDYYDFLNLVSEKTSAETKFSYILKALKLGMNSEDILALFDEENEFDPNDFLENGFGIDLSEHGELKANE